MVEDLSVACRRSLSSITNNSFGVFNGIVPSYMGIIGEVGKFVVEAMVMFVSPYSCGSRGETDTPTRSVKPGCCRAHVVGLAALSEVADRRGFLFDIVMPACWRKYPFNARIGFTWDSVDRLGRPPGVGGSASPRVLVAAAACTPCLSQLTVFLASAARDKQTEESPTPKLERRRQFPATSAIRRMRMPTSSAALAKVKSYRMSGVLQSWGEIAKYLHS